MTNVKMHADEPDIDADLVARLLAEQLPDWAGLPVEAVPSAGTDNALYRLGNDRVVRLPRRPESEEQAHKEQEWLPRLAPHLPLEVPVPLAFGKPGAGYPWSWSVYPWVDGENATLERLSDPVRAARELGRFLIALQRIDTSGGPTPGRHNFFRGVPLAARDKFVRASLDALRGVLDTGPALAAWETALRAPALQGPPVWIHGDLQSGNLLASEGRLRAVIDFGGLGVGDPACELIVAWNLFRGEARRAFRDALHVDAATWERGKGWALSVGLIALPYYWETNPEIVRSSQETIAEVLGEAVFRLPLEATPAREGSG